MRLPWPPARSCGTRAEVARYSPFVEVLNGTLCHFRKLKLGRGNIEKIQDKDIIFAINDPIVIESTHLDESTKRKPDLICLLARKFRSLWEDCENDPFSACVIVAATSTLKGTKSESKPPKSKEKATWGDILHSWELKANREINLVIRKDFKAEEFLGKDGKEIPLRDVGEPSAASISEGKCVFVLWIHIYGI